MACTLCCCMLFLLMSSLSLSLLSWLLIRVASFFVCTHETMATRPQRHYIYCMHADVRLCANYLSTMRKGSYILTSSSIICLTLKRDATVAYMLLSWCFLHGSSIFELFRSLLSFSFFWAYFFYFCLAKTSSITFKPAKKIFISTP